MGFSYVAVGNDASLLRQAAEQVRKKFAAAK